MCYCYSSYISLWLPWFPEVYILLMRALGSEGLLVSGVSLKLELLNLELRAFEDPGVAGASIWIHHIVARQV